MIKTVSIASLFAKFMVVIICCDADISTTRPVFNEVFTFNSEVNGTEMTQVCGRNSLFMYLKMIGSDADYSEVKRCVPIGSRGTSLLDLRKAASELGVQLTIGRREPKVQETLKLPQCIALMQGARKEDPGHYVIVEGKSRHNHVFCITIIDGSYGNRKITSPDEFASTWTGYYLAEQASIFDEMLIHMSIWFALSIVGFFAWTILSGPNGPIAGKRRVKSSTALGFLIIGFVFFDHTNQAFGDQGDRPAPNVYDRRNGTWEPWRTPKQDAANSLYMLLRINNIDFPYNELQSSFNHGRSSQNLLDIQKIAGSTGLNTSIYRCTPAALASLTVPVIAYMESTDTGPGGFTLVLPMRDRNGIAVIRGDTAQMSSVKNDDFLRAWNGYLLVPSQDENRNIWALTGCLLIVFILARLYMNREVLGLRPGVQAR